MLILCGKYHREKWVKENDWNDNLALAVSDIGYSNDEISFEWLDHFDKHTQKNRKSVCVCL